ncbi:uncharacterized protein LOC144618325 [Crassostrea virginica]
MTAQVYTHKTTELDSTTEGHNLTSTTTPTTHSGLPKEDLEIIIIVICLIAFIGIIIVLLYIILKKFRYSNWFLWLINLARRRSSTTGSHHPLEPDDVEDLPPPRTEREEVYTTPVIGIIRPSYRENSAFHCYL